MTCGANFHYLELVHGQGQQLQVAEASILSASDHRLSGCDEGLVSVYSTTIPLTIHVCLCLQ